MKPFLKVIKPLVLMVKTDKYYSCKALVLHTLMISHYKNR